MVENNRIKKNMLMSVILQVANFLFPLITFSYVSHVLSPVGTGKVAFVKAIVSYFSYVCILGIPSYGRRECAKLRDNKEELSQVTQELLIIGGVSTTVTYIIFFISIFVVPKFNGYLKLFFIMGTSFALETIGAEWLYQGLEEYEYITKRSILFKVISVVLTLVFINDSGDYLYYGLISTITTYGSYIFNFIHLRKYVSLKKSKTYNFSRHLKPIMLMFAAYLAMTIYNNFDVSMLGFIKDDNEVGQYNAAIKIKNVVVSFSSAATSVIVPRMAYYIEKKDIDKSRNLILNSLRVSMSMSFPMAIYCFMYAKDIVSLLCGIEYLESIPTMRMLMLCVLPLILTNLFGNQLLIPLGLERYYSRSVIIGLFINIGLNLVLIPPLGALGATIGTIITEIWNAIYMGANVGKYKNIVLRDMKYGSYIAALLCALLGSYFAYLAFEDSAIFLRILSSSGRFFALYYIVLLILKEPLVLSGFSSVAKRFAK